MLLSPKNSNQLSKFHKLRNVYEFSVKLMKIYKMRNWHFILPSLYFKTIFYILSLSFFQEITGSIKVCFLES